LRRGDVPKTDEADAGYVTLRVISPCRANERRRKTEGREEGEETGERQVRGMEVRRAGRQECVQQVKRNKE